MRSIKEQHLVFALILVVALLRWLPHAHNMAPIGALALFAGAYIDRRIFWLVPLGALFLGDVANGLYHGVVLVAVYLGFLASTLIARQVLFERDQPLRIVAGGFLGAGAFWLISNFGSWLAFRPLTLDGLVSCYVDAIPYFGRSLLADACYALVLFGAFRLLRSQLAPRLAS